MIGYIGPAAGSYCIFNNDPQPINRLHYILAAVNSAILKVFSQDF